MVEFVDERRFTSNNITVDSHECAYVFQFSLVSIYLQTKHIEHQQFKIELLNVVSSMHFFFWLVRFVLKIAQITTKLMIMSDLFSANEKKRRLSWIYLFHLSLFVHILGYSSHAYHVVERIRFVCFIIKFLQNYIK